MMPLKLHSAKNGVCESECASHRAFLKAPNVVGVLFDFGVFSFVFVFCFWRVRIALSGKCSIRLLNRSGKEINMLKNRQHATCNRL